MTKKRPRFRVSDIGYGYAVHDTQHRQEYAHPAGSGKEHATTNALSSKILEVFATFEQAQALADRLNAADRSREP